ncbi:hypothetical protein TNCV_5056961 [Trichonephila clavipes]|nr:hypothetical protein TNCV_5056961 [Trichonephila clavipes]
MSHCKTSTWAIGGGPRNIETWSSDEDEPELAPLPTSTQHQRENILGSTIQRASVPSARWVFSCTSHRTHDPPATSPIS